MFEYIYSQESASSRAVAKSLEQIKGTPCMVPLVWTEHCIECAAPRCYSTCLKFQPRTDGHCVRISDGISPVAVDGGRVATQVVFREWAKIEAQMMARPLPWHRSLAMMHHLAKGDRLAKWSSRIMPFRRGKKFILEGWFSLRQHLINNGVKGVQPCLALDLVASVVNEGEDASILVDIKNDSKLLFRESVAVPNSRTAIKLPLPPFDSRQGDLYFINVHPGDAEKPLNLVFDYLEVIERDVRQGKKVKCVVWDLDNTLWHGVLIENKDVKPREEFVDLIRTLDHKGIVNSIASKNNIEDVEEKLRQIGIADLFVFKKVNWNPKSANLALTVKQMNINPDTVVFVDDNEFERMEVAQKLPSVTCVHPDELLDFVQCERFDVTVTDDSMKRRVTYHMMEQLKEEEERWDGDIDDFLKSCKITATLRHPSDGETKRCYELLQRTNQLNASGRRLSLEEAASLVHDPKHSCYVISSDDKFGNYGIVGFIAVDEAGDVPVITDFVISCRVANKKIEPTVVNYLARKSGMILFNYKITKLNGPMFQITKELNMSMVETKEECRVYRHEYNPEYGDVVKVMA